MIIYGSLDELSGGFLYDRRMKKELELLGHSVSVLKLPWRRYGRALLDNLDRALLVRIAELEADILLQDELCHPSFFGLNRRLGETLDRPRYGIVHHLRVAEDHSPPLVALYRWVERRYLASLDGFIFNSEATRQSVEDLLGARVSGVVAYPGRDHLTPNGENQKGPAAQPESLRILFVGSLIHRKGLDLLLDALTQMPTENWQLDIAGRADLEPNYAAAIRRRLAAEPFQSNASYHGAVRTADLEYLYRQADVLAVPSRHEGFGLVYLEAMGYGLPVLASTAGGAHELVEGGKHGALIEPGDVPAVRQVLQEYLDQPGRLQAHSTAARRRFQQHPQWRESARSVIRYLESESAAPIVNKPRPHADPQ